MIPQEIKLEDKKELAKGGYIRGKPIIIHSGCIIPSADYTVTDCIKENLLPPMTITLSKDELGWIDQINKAFYERKLAAWHINKS